MHIFLVGCHPSDSHLASQFVDYCKWLVYVASLLAPKPHLLLFFVLIGLDIVKTLPRCYLQTYIEEPVCSYKKKLTTTTTPNPLWCFHSTKNNLRSLKNALAFSGPDQAHNLTNICCMNVLSNMLLERSSARVLQWCPLPTDTGAAFNSFSKPSCLHTNCSVSPYLCPAGRNSVARTCHWNQWDFSDISASWAHESTSLFINTGNGIRLSYVYSLPLSWQIRGFPAPGLPKLSWHTPEVLVHKDFVQDKTGAIAMVILRGDISMMACISTNDSTVFTCAGCMRCFSKMWKQLHRLIVCLKFFEARRIFKKAPRVKSIQWRCFIVLTFINFHIEWESG